MALNPTLRSGATAHPCGPRIRTGYPRKPGKTRFGDGKAMAQKEVAMAQTAMLDGKMGACAMHLGKAMHAGMMK
jgi:hypothetical protein